MCKTPSNLNKFFASKAQYTRKKKLFKFLKNKKFLIKKILNGITVLFIVNFVSLPF